MQRQPGPICTEKVGPAWIDSGTNVKTRTDAPGIVRESPQSTRAAWYAYVSRVTFAIPTDKGILWTKVGMRGAERLARAKGLVSLEILLKEEGFYEMYAKHFGSFHDVQARGLEVVTSDIWKILSRRYAASLSGKVTAFVSQQVLSKAIAKGAEPVLVDELSEISEVMLANPRIASVELVDVSSGNSSLLLRAAVLKAARATS